MDQGNVKGHMWFCQLMHPSTECGDSFVSSSIGWRSIRGFVGANIFENTGRGCKSTPNGCIVCRSMQVPLAGCCPKNNCFIGQKTLRAPISRDSRSRHLYHSCRTNMPLWYNKAKRRNRCIPRVSGLIGAHFHSFSGRKTG